MSWDYNPFKHFEIIYREETFVAFKENRKGYKGRVYAKGHAWKCCKCSAESYEGWPGTASIHAIKTSFETHVRVSHGLTPEDTKDWSE